ncbi:MAG: glycosyltransferase [Anaerolineae bacterium]|nr:hypothetical protein [Thermoflexales bacterium]MDW8408312.1 glycosyltransferase [Anaerolineae bacterium]
MAKRIVFLYGDTGGGHRSTAQAVEQALELSRPNCYQMALVNGTLWLPFPFNQSEKSYPVVVNRARFLHALVFHGLNRRLMVHLMRTWLISLGWRKAIDMVQRYPADVYVSCHPLFSQLLPPLMRRLKSPAKVVHIVTDLASGPAAHFAADLDACLVPTPQAHRQALHYGVPADRIALTGQPVWPNSRHRMAKGIAVRAALGLRLDQPVALLIGGADGMGTLSPTARAIVHSDLPVQLIVVCGRNEKLRSELEAWRANTPSRADGLRTQGFVDNIPELMGASDILISKAGTLTLCEGLLAGLPILIYDAIPGQEDGNVEYVTQGGAGVFCPSPRAVVDQLCAWLAEPAELERRREAALRLAQPDAALKAAQVIARLAEGEAID